jgi:type IV pilus assembly protein PilV
MSITNKSNIFNTQRGMGIVEVLVAMLVLAVGVLGYSVLQLRAVSATNDALTRSQAILILRGLSDSVRMNVVGQQSGNYQATPGVFNQSGAPTAPGASCTNVSFANYCTPAAFAQWDAYQYALIAFKMGIKINMLTCPGAVQSGAGSSPARQCLLAAWGNTAPTIGSNSTTVPYDCMQTAGTYNAVATCFELEAY